MVSQRPLRNVHSFRLVLHAGAALEAYADWMKYNSRSIYGCTMAEPQFKAPQGCFLTQSEDEKRLYIHLVDYPCPELRMENLAEGIDYAQFLHDGSEILYRLNDDGSVNFAVPAVQPEMLVPVIEVLLK